MSKWNIAVPALWLMVSTSAFFLPSARSQPAESQPEVYVGMIVTRTTEEAQAVLNELKSGADFGVRRKKNPSTRLRTTEARWGSSIPISCGRSCAMPWRD